VFGTYDADFRHYDPTSGRWLSPDPAGSAAVDLTNPQSLNRYAYVGNNPTSLIDPSGFCPGCAPGQQTQGCTNMVCADNPATFCGLPYCGWNLLNLDSEYDEFDLQQIPSQQVAAINVLIGFDPNGQPPVYYVEGIPAANLLDYFDSSETYGPNTNNNGVCSESDKQIVRDASVNALFQLNPAQNESNNITPLNFNFARVINPTAVSTTGWTSAFTTHGTSIESPRIPGQNVFVVKMYSDPTLGNTIAVIYPTSSLKHYLQWPIYELGGHVNANNARTYMGCPASSGGQH
jgi:RHS repeat-associated protein